MATQPVGSGLPALAAARWSVPPPSLTELRPLDDGIGLLAKGRIGGPRVHYEVAIGPAPEHVVLLVLDAAEARCAGRVGERRFDFCRRPGMATVLPAGLDAGWHAAWGAAELLHLHVTPARLRALAETEGGPGDLAPAVGLLDPGIAALLETLRRERDFGPLTPIFLEHWAMLVLLRLAALRPPPARLLALPPKRLADVLGFIEANLATDLSLGQLAAVAGLSRFHFARAFRRETGKTPFGWIAERRCELAKRLLTESPAPLAEIAPRCGFPTVSALVGTFRRCSGTTPAAWRRGHGHGHGHG